MTGELTSLPGYALDYVRQITSALATDPIHPQATGFVAEDLTALLDPRTTPAEAARIITEIEDRIARERQWQAEDEAFMQAARGSR